MGKFGIIWKNWANKPKKFKCISSQIYQHETQVIWIPDGTNIESLIDTIILPYKVMTDKEGCLEIDTDYLKQYLGKRYNCNWTIEWSDDINFTNKIIFDHFKRDGGFFPFISSIYVESMDKYFNEKTLLKRRLKINKLMK